MRQETDGVLLESYLIYEPEHQVAQCGLLASQLFMGPLPDSQTRRRETGKKDFLTSDLRHFSEILPPPQKKQVKKWLCNHPLPSPNPIFCVTYAIYMLFFTLVEFHTWFFCSIILITIITCHNFTNFIYVQCSPVLKVQFDQIIQNYSIILNRVQLLNIWFDFCPVSQATWFKDEQALLGALDFDEKYQPFLERRGDWTYCALAIR